MKDFADLPNASGTFPSVTGPDCSGPGETDGLGLTADLFNDIMGSYQALMTEVNDSPDDTAEVYNDSQILDAIRNISKYNLTWISNWTEQTPGSSYSGNFSSVAAGEDGSGNSIIVAVGSSGEIQYSRNGIDWYSNTQGTTQWNGVAYGNGYWLVVGDGGVIRYAINPTGSWTVGSSLGSNNMNDVFYGNGYWVVVGDSGDLYYRATNPTGSFTSNTQGSSNLNVVRYLNGYWLVGGPLSSVLYYETDPTTGSWSTQSTSLGTGVITGITYGLGRFVALNSNGFVAHIDGNSPIGSWTSDGDIGVNSFSRLEYGNGGFVAVNNSATSYLYCIHISDRTMNFKEKRTSIFNIDFYGLEYSEDLDFMIVVGQSGTIMTSLNHG